MNEKQYKAYMASKFIKDVEDIDKEGKDCISFALKCSFTKDHDMDNVMKTILQNIPEKVYTESQEKA